MQSAFVRVPLLRRLFGAGVLLLGSGVAGALVPLDAAPSETPVDVGTLLMRPRLPGGALAPAPTLVDPEALHGNLGTMAGRVSNAAALATSALEPLSIAI